MKRALLSVYNKEGIEEFAKDLIDLGWEIIASEGTAKTLNDANIPVQDIAAIVGGNSILNHRVVTLSREIHAGLLATNSSDDIEELKRSGILRIDLLCVDLYPLKKEIESENSTSESVTEKTDIGGPAMLRSAAKGKRIVICDPIDRIKTIDWLKAGKPNEEDFIRELSAKAEAIVANYCLVSARYHSQGNYDGLIGSQAEICRYGENAWQTPAKLLSVKSKDPLSLDKFKHIAGIKPSWNNLVELDRLLQTITHIAAGFDLNYSNVPLIAIGSKHGNACGAAVGNNPIEVIEKMIKGNDLSIFGGIVITNFPIGRETAKTLIHYLMPEGQRRLLDCIIAPFFDESIEILERKSNYCRFLANPTLANLNKESLDSACRFRYARGSFFTQPNYTFILDLKDPRLEKNGEITEKQEKDLILAWAIGSTSNSNTITLVRDQYLIGNGIGQQDRVSACKLAIHRANDVGHNLNGAVAYSDSFFPFPDGPAVLAKAGIKTILASSGSIRDNQVKAFCKEKELVLYLIPDKIGRGFFNH